jgi:hypothetical protein
VILPGLETNNPYYSGPRARMALISELVLLKCKRRMDRDWTRRHQTSQAAVMIPEILLWVGLDDCRRFQP